MPVNFEMISIITVNAIGCTKPHKPFVILGDIVNKSLAEPIVNG
jgi:hypothetical protein